MRKRLILAFVVFVLVAAPAIALVWTCVVPEYQARAEVRVRPFIPHLVFQTEDNGLIPFHDAYVNTQVSVMRSPTVLQRVLDQPEVQKTQWYKNQKPRISLVQRLIGITPYPLEMRNDVLENLRDNLKVQCREQTEIIDITFTDPSAQDVKVIVDSILDQYRIYTGQKSNQDGERIYELLTEEYKSLEEKIRGHEALIANVQRSIQTKNPQELITSKRLRLDETEARVSELRQTISLLEWEKQHAVADDNNDVRVSAVDVPATPVDPNGSLHSKLITSLEHQLARAEREEELLVEYCNKQQQEFAALFATAQLVERENNALKHERDLFNAVRQRLDQKNMERNVRDVIATMDVLTRAYVPSEPHRDRRVLFTAIALVVGLGLSSGVAFLPGRRRKQ